MSDILAKLHVIEHDGIRQFLYPLYANLNRELRRQIDDGIYTLADEAGTALPTRIVLNGTARGIWFAHSLTPFADRVLHLVPTDHLVDVPDAMGAGISRDGTLATTQSRVSFKINSRGSIHSCLYDGFEHLAAPSYWTFDSKPLDHERLQWTDLDGIGVHGVGTAGPSDPAISLQTSVTACKSWILQGVEFRTRGSAVVSWHLPMNLPGDNLIVDCGLGNGVYLRSSAPNSSILIEIDSEKKSWCTWRAGFAKTADVRQAALSGESCESAFTRIDYSSTARTFDLASRVWLHAIAGQKSAALAVFIGALNWRRLTIVVEPGGYTTLTALIGNPGSHGLTGVIHFLNDIPPIAAATNPASILCVPETSWLK